MLTVKEAWATLDAKDVHPQTPDYSHINPDIIVEATVKLKFDDIFIDDAQGNTARMVDGTDQKAGADNQHILDLTESFSQGVILTEPLPALQHPQNSGNDHLNYRYRLRYGFGRSLTIKGMGADGWFFHVIQYRKGSPSYLKHGSDLTQDDWDGVTLSENEYLPKMYNKHANIIHVIKQQIARKSIPNTEEAIKARIDKYLPHRKGQSKSKIAEQVMADKGTPFKYAFWNDTKIDLWVDNTLDSNIPKYVSKGKWDEKREMWGYTSSINGLSRTYGQAIRKYAQTGHKSYVILHFGNPSAKVPMMAKRLNGIEEYCTLRSEYAEVYGKNVEVLKVMGAMPQINMDSDGNKVDKWDRLVELKIPKFKPLNKSLSYKDTNVSPLVVNKIDEKLGLLPNNGFNTSELERKGLEVADRTGRLKKLKYA